MEKAWMTDGRDIFVEHLYLPGWELLRKKRAEESSEDADTFKRVRYDSESEDDRPARDRRKLQERERDDRDLNKRKARERRTDRGCSSNRERSRGRDDDRRQDSRKYDNKKGGGQAEPGAAPSQGAVPNHDPTKEVSL